MGEDFVERLRDFLEADARILGKYYNDIIAPELTAMEQSDSEKEQQNYKIYMDTYKFAAGQNEITKDAVRVMEEYREAQKAALGELRENAMMHAF